MFSQKGAVLCGLILCLVIGQSCWAIETVPLPEHPRPDFQRSPWVNLNGPWEFAFDLDNVGIERRWFEVGGKQFAVWLGRQPSGHVVGQRARMGVGLEQLARDMQRIRHTATVATKIQRVPRSEAAHQLAEGTRHIGHRGSQGWPPNDKSLQNGAGAAGEWLPSRSISRFGQRLGQVVACRHDPAVQVGNRRAMVTGDVVTSPAQRRGPVDDILASFNNLNIHGLKHETKVFLANLKGLLNESSGVQE